MNRIYTAHGHKLRFSDKQGCLSDSATGILAGRYKTSICARVKYGTLNNQDQKDKPNPVNPVYPVKKIKAE